MLDSEKLKGVINESGIKMYKLASELNLSPYGFALKVNGKNDFKASEIVKLCNILKLEGRRRDEIFFPSL